MRERPQSVGYVLQIYHKEKPAGVIVQFGGQTPLNIARALSDEGVKILGTSIDSIDIAEALACVKQIGGYPVMIRPS